MGKVGSDAVEVVGGQDDRQPVAVQVAEEVEDLVAGPEIDTRGRLVHQQQLRSTEQCPGDEHSLLLASGQLANVPVGKRGDLETLQDRVDLGPLAAAAPRPHASAGAGHEDALADRHREVPVDGLDLRDVADAQAGRSVDGAGARPYGAQERPQQGRLPRPRGADDPGELTFGDAQVDVDEGGRTAVRARHSLELDETRSVARRDHCG